LELKRLKLRREKPRAVQTDVVVDTGSTRLYLKRSVIKALGLRKEGEIGSKTTNGTRRRAVYQAARLELMRRDGFSTNPERSAFDLWPSDLGLNRNPELD